MEIAIYCDGSCYHKTKLGGIGVYMKWHCGEYYISQGFKNTTISRMEGRALHSALKVLDRNLPITATIYSDSEYIVRSFTEQRLLRWQSSHWFNVANTDMWRAILSEIEAHPHLQLNFIHVRGHQKDISNDHAFGNAVADCFADFKRHSEYLSDNYFHPFLKPPYV